MAIPTTAGAWNNIEATMTKRKEIYRGYDLEQSDSGEVVELKLDGKTVAYCRDWPHAYSKVDHIKKYERPRDA